MTTRNYSDIGRFVIDEFTGFDSSVNTFLEYHPGCRRSGSLPSGDVVLIRERGITGNDINTFGKAVRTDRDHGSLKAGQQVAAERRTGFPAGIVYDLPDQATVPDAGSAFPRRIISVEVASALDRELRVLYDSFSHVVKRLHPGKHCGDIRVVVQNAERLNRVTPR